MAWSIELVTSKQEKLLRAGQHAAFAVGSCYGASFHQLVATACCHGAPTCPARCRQRFKNAHAGCHKKGVNRVTGIACNTTDFGICGAVLLDDVGCIVVRDSIVDARDALKVVALKQLKLAAVKSDDGFPSPSLREISLLLEIEHPNVVQCREVVFSSADQEPGVVGLCRSCNSGVWMYRCLRSASQLVPYFSLEHTSSRSVQRLSATRCSTYLW